MGVRLCVLVCVCMCLGSIRRDGGVQTRETEERVGNSGRDLKAVGLQGCL